MSEPTQQKKQLCRKSKPFPLMNLIRGNSNSSNNKKNLGSGVTSPVILNSMTRLNDPYMPHITANASTTSLPTEQHHKHPVRRSMNSSTPHLVTQSKRQPVTTSHIIHHHHHYYLNSPTTDSFNYQLYNNTQLPPLSPPPLSPTNVSFAATTSRPSWRDTKRSPTWQPASSISSSDLDDDDDDEPLGLLKPFSLLNDASDEEDDEDLIPIAHLSISTTTHRLSAAEKYKAKVRARLQMSDNNNNEIPL